MGFNKWADVSAEQQELRKKILEKHGNKCARCGFADLRALQIDHVNGDGYAHKKSYKGSTTRYYRDILSDIEGKFQVLCANCNWIKRYENGETRKIF